MPTLDEVLAVILGGGRGTRLFPLTLLRSKPAVPIAGKYRLIDIPISNCINSGIFRIAVLTQYNSVSLHRHITNTYQFDNFHRGWVQIWAAEQTLSSSDWYQGTADAVRKQLFEIRATRARYVLILAGDHLYRMNYAPMFRQHLESGAEITVAVKPVPTSEAPRFGILKRDLTGRIVRFAEKPKDPDLLAEMVSRDDPERPYIGSMGIYLFNIETLIKLLEEHPEFDDFGGEVIPYAINYHHVYSYDFDGYWEDIGTIRSFYETNLALTDPNPPFNFFDPEFPIYSHPRFLPGSTIERSVLENVLLAEGCCIRNAEIRRSVIGLRSRIRNGARIENTVLMGADYYEKVGCEDYDETMLGTVPIGIGPGCEISGAIIDKNARIGRGVIIRPFPRGTDLDGNGWVVRDGIVVIPKDGIIQPGTYIGPELKPPEPKAQVVETEKI
ncbi:MAG: glucose-1-phosphate adenylyltransferase [Thermanaerothrix sp.]|jgi:glucose-1-phosphate adenylyltransferase|uniref:Glucose-1-phosphate adenylyltransferase n=1 Tax=Thermanaerothrix solaris TaxID=3058434 RepID=A0ABU3NPQ0_9CHLR|nr:glucose-1-phosphate adenylyltransferase [Thermanaerothrix sp. 4228-RoL]MDT8898823.1 glucose-1-phosphate adenylyltransferase [Thermanaerothrix sp. 4228-RoL]